MAEALTLQVHQDQPIPLAAELACKPGELLALVGPSGSGKTTLLRAIAGLARPGNGIIRCAGETWFDSTRDIFATPQARRVGMVFQDYALFPHMTAAGNVMAALDSQTGQQARSRALGLLERVNLSGLEDRKPNQLSGGQRQRVALARALARDPRVLLLDEPFSAVDQVTRRKLQEELLAMLRSLALPVVLVTHDLGEARALADTMAILHHGRTLQTDTPDTVMRKPASPLVARLLDIGNDFQATVQAHEAEATVLDWQGHRIETAPAPHIDVGREVQWTVPPAYIVLHRRDRPSRGERENPVEGRVTRLLETGGEMRATIDITGIPDQPLTFTLPVHAARRNGLAHGVEVRVSILSDAVHIFDPETA